MTSVVTPFGPAIDACRAVMLERVQRWASINSDSNNASGLSEMLESLKEAFEPLSATLEVVECPGAVEASGGEPFPRSALRVSNQAPGRPILLNGHYDTVYGREHPFQDVERVSNNRLRGPGVADMKGGLVVLLTALEIWEASAYAGRVSWEVLITPDEEIASPASIPLLEEAASRCAFGLIYESSYPDGGFVYKRKGSAVYTVRARGRAAHVGRNFEEGRNAILGLAKVALEIAELAEDLGLIANAGKVSGGGPLNVVPDNAEISWNVRASKVTTFTAFEAGLDTLLKRAHSDVSEGIQFEWSGGICRPPKEVDRETELLYEAVEKCARLIGLPVSWRDTGGGSDGSNLAAYGLPNIDNLGVRGGAIHSSEEFLEVDSLVERVALTLEIFRATAEGTFYQERIQR